MTKMIDTSLVIDASGPAGFAVVNNLRFLINPVFYVLDRLNRFSGNSVVPLTNGNGSLVILRGPEATKQFFTDTDSFHRVDDGTFRLPDGFPWSRMFDSVLTANEHEHRRRRKLLMPVFHQSAMDHYKLVFADTFRGSKFALSNGSSFDMANEFRIVARTNMLVCLMGLGPSAQNLDIAKRVAELLDSMFNPLTMMFRLNRPWTPYGRWLSRVADTCHLLTNLVERKRIEQPRRDALSILCHTTDESGDYLTTSEIAGELHGLFAAGYETTASAMIWTMLACLAEPNLVLEDLDNVINETQRLIPTVPMSLPRRATRDIQVGSTVVPRGAVALVSPLLEHRNPQVFQDPHAFSPGRWREFRPTPYSFFPFGVGKRRCLGAGFADLQVRTTIRMALESADWRALTTSIDYAVKSGIISFPKKPIFIRNGGGIPLASISGSVARLWQPGSRIDLMSQCSERLRRTHE